MAKTVITEEAEMADILHSDSAAATKQRHGDVFGCEAAEENTASIPSQELWIPYSEFLPGCSRTKGRMERKTVKKDIKQPSIFSSSTSRSSNSSSSSSTDGQTIDSSQTIYAEERSDTDATGNRTTFSTLFSRQPSKSWMAFESENTIASMADYKEPVSSLNILTEARIETTELGLETKPEAGEGSVGAIIRNMKREREDGNRSENAEEGSESTEKSPGETSPAFSHGFKDALAGLQQAFVVSDATKPDCPIVCASTGFLTMTGYSSEEVIGRNCRFLQGPETDKTEVDKIRDAIKNEKSYCGRLLNYRKNGSSFWNLLTISPIRDDLCKVILFIGMQVEVKKFDVKDKPLHPNELSKSPISQASQKESVLGSITEVVQTELAFVLPESAEADNFNKDHRDYFPRSSSYADRGKISRLSRSVSFKGYRERSMSLSLPGKYNQSHFNLTTKNVQRKESLDYSEREPERSQGIDLAIALERFEKNFVITDPRLPDHPIIFASDSFLRLTEYSRKEILGRNCRFLQGVETDRATVSKISDAIREQKEITVQLLNYTKSGKKFWNLFHLQPMRHQKGDLQYFIGVQLDVSSCVNPSTKLLSDKTEQENVFLVKSTAEKVDEAVRKLPNAHLRLEELMLIYSQPVFPRPHKKDTPSWVEIQKITARGEKIGLHHFKPIKPLGYGDAGSVHLVELEDTRELYAVKAMKKSIHRACTEREIISLLDHPFLPTLYSSFQTPTHFCLVTDFYPGGELFDLLDKQPMKMFNEESARFYAAEVVVGLEYLHCLGIIYRDLKPENILLQRDGHVVLTDFDLSLNTSCRMQIMNLPSSKSRRYKDQTPMLVVKPVLQSSSFVGTEEYMAPEIIAGTDHTSSMDWWSLGILLYEMLYGCTPFKGKDRQETFCNILQKDVTFPSSILVSRTARQFIKALLQKDPADRLGSSTGAIEFKQHPFFHRINWPLIRCMTPPPLEVPLQVVELVQKAKIPTREEHPLVSQHRRCNGRVTNEIVHSILG